VSYQLRALWSINERLGGNDGEDMPEPTNDWLESIEMMKRAECEAEKEINNGNRNQSASPNDGSLDKYTKAGSIAPERQNNSSTAKQAIGENSSAIRRRRRF
jgi:hypothetical protein